MYNDDTVDSELTTAKLVEIVLEKERKHGTTTTQNLDANVHATGADQGHEV